MCLLLFSFLLTPRIYFQFQIKSDLSVMMRADDSQHPSTITIIPINETNEMSHLNPEVIYNFGNVTKDNTVFKLISSREGMLCTYKSTTGTLCGLPVRILDIIVVSRLEPVLMDLWATDFSFAPKRIVD